MKFVLRSLIIWLMLLAVPFQGVALASMLPCAAPVAAMAAQAMPDGHDHAAMLAAAAQEEGAGDSVADDAHCGAAGACCAGALLAPVVPDCLSMQAAASQAIPFYSGYPAAVDLAGPERPPQAPRA